MHKHVSDFITVPAPCLHWHVSALVHVRGWVGGGGVVIVGRRGDFVSIRVFGMFGASLIQNFVSSNLASLVIPQAGSEDPRDKKKREKMERKQERAARISKGR